MMEKKKDREIVGREGLFMENVESMGMSLNGE